MSKRTPRKKWVVIAGNVVEGITVFGPYKSHQDAQDAAWDMDDWVVTEIHNMDRYFRSEGHVVPKP